MTWSDTIEEQHLNPLSIEDFENLMIKNNFVKNESKTKLLYDNTKTIFENKLKFDYNQSKLYYMKYPDDGVSLEMGDVLGFPDSIYHNPKMNMEMTYKNNPSIPAWYLDTGLSVWEKK